MVKGGEKMEKGPKHRKALKDAPGYEIVFQFTGRKRECLMGLWDARAGKWALETIYSNMAEDRFTLADGTSRFLLHTTRKLDTGEYRFGCFEPGKGWMAGGEHQHVERILIFPRQDGQAETFWLWVYDELAHRHSYRHRIYDGQDRLSGSFVSHHEAAQPYEEIDYQQVGGRMVFGLRKNGRTVFDKSFTSAQ